MDASARAQRTLFDNSIKVNGRVIDAFMFHIDEDKYGNEDIEILSEAIIEAIILYPTEIPLDRIQGLEESNVITSDRLFFFDLLPIEIFTKWSDKVQKNDFIVHLIKNDIGKKFPIILKISENLGAFSTELLWRKSLCSPYRGEIPSILKTKIESKINE